MRAEADRGLQAITLRIEWRGGRGIDVVSIVHNDLLIRSEPRSVLVERGWATVEYDVPPATSHQLRVVLAFIGDLRTDLALHCFVDGVELGGPIRARTAEHRWEVRGGWTPGSPVPSEPPVSSSEDLADLEH